MVSFMNLTETIMNIIKKYKIDIGGSHLPENVDKKQIFIKP